MQTTWIAFSIRSFVRFYLAALLYLVVSSAFNCEQLKIIKGVQISGMAWRTDKDF